MAYQARELARLGYKFVEGPSGLPSDRVLRSTEDSQKGFEYKSQANYDAVGEAVFACIQGLLVSDFGLEALPLPRAGSALGGEAHAVVYATPALLEQTAPLLLLVCGAPPGGAAGIWARSLCINGSTHEGAMFDYILRAQRLGWSVLVANPNANDVAGTPIEGSECPHLHLQTLWRSYVEPSAASCVMIVAHSYGAPSTTHLLKTEDRAKDRIRAIAFTDGWVSPPGTLLCEALPEGADAGGQSDDGASRLARYAELAPAAFQPGSSDLSAWLAEVGRDFTADQRPAGTPVAADKRGVPAVSAGHEKHVSTTHAATEVVFAFLQEGAEGKAAESNAELRTRCPPAGGESA